MYRSNHFESQNVGQSLSVGEDAPLGKSVAVGKSSLGKSSLDANQQMPFTSSVQSVNTNSLPNPHSGSHLSASHVSTSHVSGNLNHQNAHRHTPSAIPPLSQKQAQAPISPAPLSSRLEQKAPLQTRSLQQVNEQAAFPAQATNKSPLGKDFGAKKPVTDEQISDLFTAMGKASQLSQSQLAARLQTSPALIAALESGSLNDLPEWEEIEPVISRYAEFMNIDDRPILRRMREQLTEHFLTNMTADTPSTLETLTPHKQTPPPLQGSPLQAAQDQNGSSIMPSSDMSLKAFANGNLTQKHNEANQFHSDVSPELNSASQLNAQALEDRFTALTSAVSNSQNSSHIIAHTQSQQQPLDTRSAIAGVNATAQQMQGYANGQQQQTPLMGQQANYSNPQFLSTNTQPTGQPPVSQMALKPKSKNKWLRIFGNIALVMILLVGFINWQPNRFWSGVDQLPKPISKSIYTLFEFVMPDPLASVYRMNWVHVADPRMRKADKLPVPAVRKLPRLDFSKLGPFNN